MRNLFVFVMLVASFSANADRKLNSFCGNQGLDQEMSTKAALEMVQICEKISAIGVLDPQKYDFAKSANRTDSVALQYATEFFYEDNSAICLEFRARKQELFEKRITAYAKQYSSSLSIK